MRLRLCKLFTLSEYSFLATNRIVYLQTDSDSDSDSNFSWGVECRDLHIPVWNMIYFRCLVFSGRHHLFHWHYEIAQETGT